MALQTAVALGAGFGVGFVVFPAHWGWTVLTAFIVCSGGRGRGDALYVGVLRFVGAVAGTLVAAAILRVWAPVGAGEAVAVCFVLYLGLVLRELNYGYWAACMTLVLALLADDGPMSLDLLNIRLAAILVGALCAVAAAWFVFPIPTEAVIRRRLADLLHAIADLIASDPQIDVDAHARRLAILERRMTELNRAAPPVRWLRRLFAPAQPAHHPAHWIDVARDIDVRARALDLGAYAVSRRTRLRRAVGAARRASAARRGEVQDADLVPLSTALHAVHAALGASSASDAPHADPSCGARASTHALPVGKMRRRNGPHGSAQRRAGGRAGV
jgi:uncharacterized membrane protein YccC